MKSNMRNRVIGWGIGFGLAIGSLALFGAWDSEEEKASPKSQEEAFENAWSQMSETEREDMCFAIFLVGEEEMHRMIGEDVSSAVDVDYMMSRLTGECNS